MKMSAPRWDPRSEQTSQRRHDRRAHPLAVGFARPGWAGLCAIEREERGEWESVVRMAVVPP